MAEVAGLEPTTTESKSVVLPITLHLNIYKAQNITVLPIGRFSKFLARKMGLEPITHNNMYFAVCAFIYFLFFITYIL